MKPNILNPDWQYTNAASTDVAATFKRIRKEQEDADAATKSIVVLHDFRDTGNPVEKNYPRSNWRSLEQR